MSGTAALVPFTVLPIQTKYSSTSLTPVSYILLPIFTVLFTASTGAWWAYDFIISNIKKNIGYYYRKRNVALKPAC